MDKIDLSIIAILKRNARTPNSDIAKTLKMAPSAIWERIKKLEERKIITKYCAIIDPKAIDLSILAFIKIKVNSPNWSDACSRQIKAIPNITEFHEVLGEDSYIAKIRAKDMDELSDILKKHIGVIKEVKSTQTTIVTKTVKEEN